VAEGEPDCGDLEDINGGCNHSPPLFTQVACGQTICGTIASQSGAVIDDDWFALTLDAPTRVSWSVTTDTNLLTGIMETVPPGSPNCSYLTGTLNPSLLVAPTGCDPQPHVFSACLGPGNYWFRVAVSNTDTGTVPCPAWYRVSLECGPFLVGDRDCDGGILDDWGDYLIGCLRGPGVLFDAFDECRLDGADQDGDGDVDLGDVARFGLVEESPPCTPGTAGCGWKTGEVITYSQNQWGEASTPAGALLAAHYNSLYAATGGVLAVGLIGTGGFSMAFQSVGPIFAYLPAIGAVGALDADLVDPTTTSSGSFGGEVLALQLNIDFADAGHMDGSTGLHVGDLTICNTPLFFVNGTTVRTFAGFANSALGGGSAPHSITVLNDIAFFVNSAFIGGSPSRFAQNNLFNGACPCTPTTCAALGADCGTLADGCGGTLDCGTCTDPEICGGGGTTNVCGVPSCTPGTPGCG
jgi:hypothetical protein